MSRVLYEQKGNRDKFIKQNRHFYWGTKIWNTHKIFLEYVNNFEAFYSLNERIKIFHLQKLNSEAEFKCLSFSFLTSSDFLFQLFTSTFPPINEQPGCTLSVSCSALRWSSMGEMLKPAVSFCIYLNKEMLTAGGGIKTNSSSQIQMSFIDRNTWTRWPDPSQLSWSWSRSRSWSEGEH